MKKICAVPNCNNALPIVGGHWRKSKRKYCEKCSFRARTKPNSFYKELKKLNGDRTDDE